MIVRWAAAAAFSLLVFGGPSITHAVPDPGSPPVADPSTPSDRCALRRVHHQYVRCDAHTGNGVRAPSWVPELQTTRAR